MIPESVRDRLSDVQAEALEAVREYGGKKPAARALGKNYRSFCRLVDRAEKTLSHAGYAPGHWADGVAPGYKMGKVTVQRSNGVVERVWERQHPDNTLEALQKYVEGLSDEMPRAKPIKAAKQKYREDLMPAIFIGDAHIGMRAFAKETKHSNFDTDIAVSQLRQSVDYLVDKAEPAKNGLLVDVGDYQHANGHNNQTFKGTPLDVDTRHRSTMYEGAMTMRYMITRMLDKCQKLTVVVARGNHNDDAAPAIELMLRFYYENEPRVNVLPVHGYYHYLEYGGNLLGIHHGDKQKPESLVSSMARDMPEAWGRTNFRMWCTGHFHKDQVRTFPGCKHKVFAALPPPDSWHASQGYSGDGEMEMLTFRREGGIQSSFVYRIPAPRIEPDARIFD